MVTTGIFSIGCLLPYLILLLPWSKSTWHSPLRLQATREQRSALASAEAEDSKAMRKPKEEYT